MTWRAALGLLGLGGSLGVLILGVWGRRRWLARDADQITQAIAGNAYRYRAGMTHADEDLQQRTQAQRQIADQSRTRAARIETGCPAADGLRRVR